MIQLRSRQGGREGWMEEGRRQGGRERGRLFNKMALNSPLYVLYTYRYILLYIIFQVILDK